jgi:hypothetical protein
LASQQQRPSLDNPHQPSPLSNTPSKYTTDARLFNFQIPLNQLRNSDAELGPWNLEHHLEITVTYTQNHSSASTTTQMAAAAAGGATSPTAATSAEKNGTGPIDIVTQFQDLAGFSTNTANLLNGVGTENSMVGGLAGLTKKFNNKPMTTSLRVPIKFVHHLPKTTPEPFEQLYERMPLPESVVDQQSRNAAVSGMGGVVVAKWDGELVRGFAEFFNGRFGKGRRIRRDERGGDGASEMGYVVCDFDSFCVVPSVQVVEGFKVY